MVAWFGLGLFAGALANGWRVCTTGAVPPFVDFRGCRCARGNDLTLLASGFNSEVMLSRRRMALVVFVGGFAMVFGWTACSPGTGEIARLFMREIKR